MARPAATMTMPTFTATDAKTNGFTLIELMVVIFLIGLAAGAVVLTMPSSGSGVRQEAESLAARIAAARDQAVLQSRGMAVWLRPSGYGFEQKRDGAWQPLDHKPFQTTDWKRGTGLAGAAGQNIRVGFDATGMPTAPAQLKLTNGGNSIIVDIAASGEVHVAR